MLFLTKALCRRILFNKILMFALLMLLMNLYLVWHLVNQNKMQTFFSNSDSNQNREALKMIEPTKIAITCCGHKVIEQTLVLIKSALIFTKSHLHLIIVSDVADNLQETIIKWPEAYLKKLTYKFITPSFPNVSNPELWRKAYGSCASQRLFFPLILPNEDTVIHIDGDFVFLSPPENILSIFKEWNPSQISGYAVDNINPKTVYYTHENDWNQFPFITEHGINSGIAPMNLTRMRQLGFFSEIQTIFTRWNKKFHLLDQDLINVYYNYHPDRLFLLPCRFNYHFNHCLSKSFCESAEKEGIALLHGTYETFRHKDRMPPFRMVYQAFRDFELGTNFEENFLEPLKKNLKHSNETTRQLRLFNYDQTWWRKLVKN